MGAKCPKKSLSILNKWFLLILIGFYPIITETAPSATSYVDRVAEAKAKLIKMIQIEIRELSGFNEYSTVPMTYPLDICLMEVDKKLYAACLGLVDFRNKKRTIMRVLKKVPPSPLNRLNDYVEIFKYETRSAQSMDCVSTSTEGYISVVNDIKTNNLDDITKGSPIFQLKNDKLIPIQYFNRPRQNRIQFLHHKNDLFMWQTFRNSGKSNEESNCPVFKWTDQTFNEIGNIPCTNAMQLEPFLIDGEVYVAVANYMDERQNVETHSAIFHYDKTTRKFNLTQNFKTYGAIDVKHVRIGDSHFLFVANSFQAHLSAHPVVTSNAVVYRYMHEKFVPMQILPFDGKIIQFLPYLGNNKEFVLLISMEEGPTKAYQYDGTIFYDSQITFTGDAFAKGISRIRTYKFTKDNRFVLIVANTAMYRDTINLFQFRFNTRIDYDFTKAYDMFNNWSKSVEDKLNTDQIVETHNEIESLKPPPGFGVINLETTKVDTIHTDTISKSSSPINFTELKRAINRAEEIISKESIRRPKRLNDSMFENDMNASLESDEDEDTFELDELGMQASHTLTVNELTVSENFFTETINGREFKDLVREDSNLNLDHFTVDRLIISDSENFEAIEKKLLDSDKRVKRQQDTFDPIVEPIILKDVIVEGLVNGINFSYIVENALRTNVQNQRLEGEINFGRLQAKSIQTNDGKISNIDLNTIARINANQTIILSPIRFTQELDVNQLKIENRLNHILIVNGQMDALFKKFRRPQEITGLKEFESVVLREPITLQGKINVTSSTFNQMRPIVTIDDDIVIEDDVSFMGNVTIGNLLIAQNMYGASIRFNAAQLLGDGLRFDESVDLPMEFIQPFQIDDLKAPSRINNISIESLIRRNVTEQQKIWASKIFTTDLSVEDGHCDANEINGVNLQMLNNTMMKRSGINQIVTGSIKFDKIQAGRVKSKNLNIGKIPYDRLLTKNTDQEINGNVTIHGNIVLDDGEVEINHLTTENSIFDVKLQQLLDDCYFQLSNESIVVTTDKFFDNLTIGELVIENDFWQADLSTEEIITRFEELKKGIIVKGPLKFTSTINISNLTVTGSINDIPSAKFGKQWLLSKGKQTFLEPQNFTDVTFNDNLQLFGSINGYDFDKLVQDSVNKSEPASLKHVIFDNIIFKKNLTIGGKLSDIQIPDDLILSHSDTLQNFNEPFVFAGDVEIIGTLAIADKLNGFNHAQFCNLIESKPDIQHRLIIKGDVMFADDPTIEYLNLESFEHMLLTTWFKNDRHVNFSSTVHFDNVIFEKPITTTGLINDIDLVDLQKRYMSLNTPQKVSTPLRFHGHVHFRNSITVDTLSLEGLIKIPQSDITLNITDFDQNVLKNTKDTQFIRGHWTVNEIRFLGNLSSTTINGLNFASDIVRWDRPDLNVIHAPKRFRSLTVEQLTCRDRCTLQGVDMEDWTDRAAMTGLNQTIQGTVYIRNPVISSIQVLGQVNNMEINSQSVLLKGVPQRMNGIVTIGNRSHIDSISSMTIENLMVNFINDKNVSEFFENLVKKDGRGNDVGEIFSNIEFINGVDFENINTDFLNGLNVNEVTSQDHIMYRDKLRAATDKLDAIVNKLIRREKFAHFDQMIVRRILSPSTQRVQRLLGYDYEFVANNHSHVEFYTWNWNTKTLHELNIPLALPENMVIIDVNVLRANPMYILLIQMEDLYTGKCVKFFYDYSNGLDQIQYIYAIAEDIQMTIEPFELDQRHCFIQYKKFNATQYIVYCMDVVTDGESKQLKVHQIDVANASEIYKITSGYANAVILWFINGEIESRQYDTQHGQTESCFRKFSNVTSVAVKEFSTQKLMAVCWHSHDSNMVNGFVSIYRIENNHLEHYADVEYPDSVILQCGLTKFSDVQTILVVAVRTSTGEMLQIYQDKGVSGFQELKEHIIHIKVPVPHYFRSNIVPEKRFSLIESQNGILKYISIYTESSVGFFECVYM
ncbi:uncharacterized protein LOC116345133 [Contarinia nasturtii]|uniref:uncharacterized protein LOC116345133 n=1 Tax=Contarinia nasturtii TaxID=265458 RepID=UPI0012D4BB43|nr:uncharacterized protein LOC116345133 [Contarinia nasturtii]